MKRSILILTIILLSSISLLAQRSTIYSTTSGTISFQSDAPFELIKASSKEVKGLLEVTKKTFAFKVKMSSFEGFNSALQQEHFNENYIESSKYPEASFTGKIIEDDDITVDGSYSIRAKGNLTIHGISQERIIKTDVIVKQGKISFKSNFTVLLSDHNIPVPKVVKDKLATEIKVEVMGLLEPR